MEEIRIPITEPVRVDAEQEECLARPRPPERDSSGGYEIKPPQPES